MSWNYRILRHKDGIFAVHEVYYDEKGVADMCTAIPIALDGDSLEDLLNTLDVIHEDAEKYKHDVLDYESFTEDAD